ncbi:MAG: hypothetical protein ACLUVI_05055 [Acutalibacteraceae bacterium]
MYPFLEGGWNLKILLEGRLRVSCGAVPSRLLGRENGAEPAD